MRTPFRATTARSACAPFPLSLRRLRQLLAGRFGLCLGLCLVLSAACGSSEAARNDAGIPDALAMLERLAFVPAGECVFQPGANTRISCANPRPLLVDRFEVTRSEWRSGPGSSAPTDPGFASYQETWTPPTADWPASYMTLAEARAFAAARGMRLPTAREWLRIACGTSERPYVYPWGGGLARSVANTLELGLGNPAPVGTFEQGRTPLSIYDMAGNVWEWVEDPIAILGEDQNRIHLDPDFAWAMGGSHLSHLRRLYDDAKGTNYFFEQDLDPRSRARDVGMRCCADAEEYLSSRSGRIRVEGFEPRLRAIGAAWGHEAAPLLEALEKRPGAGAAIRLLLEGARS